MAKFHAAREQLLTALGLFLEDRSPISVHVLAGNAREILAFLCEREGIRSLSQELFESREDSKRFLDIINEYRNAFKHFRHDDKEIFARFSDEKNDHMLYLAIEEYLRLTGKVTIAMRAVRSWYFASYPDRLVNDKQRLAEEFSYLTSWSRREQKEELRKRISERQNFSELLSDRFHEPT